MMLRKALLVSAAAIASPPGTVLAWRNQTYGQTNVPAGLTGVTAVSEGLR